MEGVELKNILSPQPSPGRKGSLIGGLVWDSFKYKTSLLSDRKRWT